MTALVTPSQCDALIAQLDAVLVDTRSRYDDLALAAADNPARAADREQLRREINALSQQREDAIAARRAAMKRVEILNTEDGQRRREAAFATATSALQEAEQIGQAVEHAVNTLASLFANLSAAEDRVRSAVYRLLPPNAATSLDVWMSTAPELDHMRDYLARESGRAKGVGTAAHNRVAAQRARIARALDVDASGRVITHPHEAAA